MKKREFVSMEMPTQFGIFKLLVWEGDRGQESVALSTPNLDPHKEVMVRVHSECLTGDVFGSHTCDCGPQKELALKMIREHGNGIFIYHRQEGRNMGLFKKIQAYNLMQGGMDTHEASLALVGHPDSREYSDVLMVLEILLSGYKSSIKLLTNNPYKVLFLERHGYPVVAEPLRAGASIHNEQYTEAKTQKFLHNSVGFGPYVGVTLSRDDVVSAGTTIANILKKFDFTNTNRKIFLGIALFPERGDLNDLIFLDGLKIFHRDLGEIATAHLVFHVDYPEERKQQRELSRFLEKLTFPYSLQFRVSAESSRQIRVDVELLDSFHAEHLIFQLKGEHFYLLEQRGLAEYFRSPNKFLLVDESWGNGVVEDSLRTRERILKLISRGLSRVAVAGGYSAENLARVHELEDYFKIPISVDAESKLRTNGKLDLSKVEKYLSYFFPQRVC